MDQIISVIGRILKGKQEPESDDQNEACKVLVVEGENNDGTVFTALSDQIEIVICICVL
jgi:hypothetical protein